MRQARRGWTMPEEDARSMLLMIEERIRASDIRVEHRDALIRPRAMIEDDLGALARAERLRSTRQGQTARGGGS